MVSSWRSKPSFSRNGDTSTEGGVRLPTRRDNWKRSHTQSSHSMQCTCLLRVYHSLCGCTYRVTFRVFSWGTPQQQLHRLSLSCNGKARCVYLCRWHTALYYNYNNNNHVYKGHKKEKVQGALFKYKQRCTYTKLHLDKQSHARENTKHTRTHTHINNLYWPVLLLSLLLLLLLLLYTLRW